MPAGLEELVALLKARGFVVVSESEAAWPAGIASELKHAAAGLGVRLGHEHGIWEIELDVDGSWRLPEDIQVALYGRPRSGVLPGHRAVCASVLSIVDDVLAGRVDRADLRSRVSVAGGGSMWQYTAAADAQRRVQEAREAGRWDLIVNELEGRSRLTAREAKLLRVARRQL